MVMIHPEGETVRLGHGPIGIVLSHGFTGTTASIRPWAHGLAAAGYRVLAPRLTGHATSWQDLDASRWEQWFDSVDRAYAELAADCDEVFVGGLSMGGALALRLAEVRPVSGVLLVNPAIASRDPAIRMARFLHWLIPATRGIASDIKAPGVSEVGYNRVSIRAVAQMNELWTSVRRDLNRVQAPVLFFKSDVDHVVDDTTLELVSTHLPHVEVVRLANSYHVATQDNDAGLIVERSAQFIAAHANAAAN